MWKRFRIQIPSWTWVPIVTAHGQWVRIWKGIACSEKLCLGVMSLELGRGKSGAGGFGTGWKVSYIVSQQPWLAAVFTLYHSTLITKTDYRGHRVLAWKSQHTVFKRHCLLWSASQMISLPHPLAHWLRLTQTYDRCRIYLTIETCQNNLKYFLKVTVKSE